MTIADSVRVDVAGGRYHQVTPSEPKPWRLRRPGGQVLCSTLLDRARRHRAVRDRRNAETVPQPALDRRAENGGEGGGRRDGARVLEQVKDGDHLPQDGRIGVRGFTEELEVRSHQ